MLFTAMQSLQCPFEDQDSLVLGISSQDDKLSAALSLTGSVG